MIGTYGRFQNNVIHIDAGSELGPKLKPLVKPMRRERSVDMWTIGAADRLHFASRYDKRATTRCFHQIHNLHKNRYQGDVDKSGAPTRG
jgi:hypothetical protein